VLVCMCIYGERERLYVCELFVCVYVVIHTHSVPLDPACTNIMWATACLSNVYMEIVSVCMYVCI